MEKKSIILVLMIIQLGGCKTKKLINQPGPQITEGGSYCNHGPGVQIDTVLMNFMAVVEKKEFLPFYILKVPYSRFTPTEILVPCDTLPIEFRHAGLIVKISGNILSNPTKTELRVADTIELTLLELIK